METCPSNRQDSQAESPQTRDPVTHLPVKARSVFISDVHLGFPGCSAEFLHHFLENTRCEFLYLVGDIIDFAYMRKHRDWSDNHSKVVERIFEMARCGTRLVYIPGNHDESMRRYVGLKMGQIEVCQEVLHITADGRRILVTHGDQFDSAVRCSPLRALIGTWVYDALLKLSGWLNWFRRKSGRGYWSLAAFVKNRSKDAVEYIARFEQSAVVAARQANVHAVICGHIHRAEISPREELSYMNCGDWVESCTGLIEHRDGRIELLQWHEKATSLKAHYIMDGADTFQGRAA